MKNFNNTYFCKCLSQDIVESKLCSRLTWKNKVYKLINSNGCAFAIKIFLHDKSDFEDRFQIELEINKLCKNCYISVPNIKDIGFTQDGDRFILYDWVDGKSLKCLLLNNKDVGIEIFKKIISNTQLLNEKRLVNNLFHIKEVERGSLIAHYLNDCNLDLNKIFNKCRVLDYNLTDLFKQTYFKLLDYVKKSSADNVLINSDISCKEFIINKDMYYLDYESYCLGDINVDYAGLFYSSVNGFIDDKFNVDKYYNFFQQQKSFDNKLFLFYLSERIIMAEVLAQDQVSLEELKFFINFVLNNVTKKSKQSIKL